VPSRANFAPGREGDKGQVDNPTVTRWFDPTAYAVPAAGFQGRAGRNTLIGPSFRRTDLSLAKRFPMGGERRFEFRADIYNVLNNVNFGQPAANISNTNVGTITAAADARSMQLGFRVIW